MKKLKQLSKNSKTKSAPEANEKVLEIEGLSLQSLVLTIEGKTPLLVNPMTEEAVTAIETKATGGTRQKAKHLDPKKIFSDKRRQLSDGRDGFPAMALKKAAVDTIAFLDIFKFKKHALGAFNVMPVEADLVPIISKTPVLDTRTATGRGGAVMVYRPRYDKWAIKFEILYNKNFVSAEELATLFQTAGFAAGIGSFRVNRGGTFGQFGVVQTV